MTVSREAVKEMSTGSGFGLLGCQFLGKMLKEAWSAD